MHVLPFHFKYYLQIHYSVPLNKYIIASRYSICDYYNSDFHIHVTVHRDIFLQ